MIFSNIAYLLLFIPLVAYVLWYILMGRRLKPSMKVSTTLPFAGKIKSFRKSLPALTERPKIENSRRPPR